jgi:hypothetical protein
MKVMGITNGEIGVLSKRLPLKCKELWEMLFILFNVSNDIPDNASSCFVINNYFCPKYHKALKHVEDL